MTNKLEAYEFLKSLHEKLDSELPPPEIMREGISSVVTEAKIDDGKKHMRQAEDAFLHHYAFPILFEHMQSVEGVDKNTVIDSLLSEYYRNMPQYCKNTPARKQRHPFNKVISTSTDSIMKQWKGELSGAKLKQSCPDFAFTDPFPFKIVFEGKYFPKGGSKKAETEFVTNVYQAFFYRGLPYDKPNDNRPAWDYNYSCLFAYDASKEGTLLHVWDSLDKDVQAGFWEGANLYVMIMRGR